MTAEHSHGKARPTLPRSRSLAEVPSAPQRHGERDAHGRFATGNKVATGKGWKSILAKQLGRDLQGEAEPLAREALVLYRGLLAELPHDGAQVRQLVAARARSAVLSGRYALRAAELGLDSEAGQRVLELSMKLDARAERLAVTALDIATKLAKADTDRARGATALHARILNAGAGE